MGTGLSRLFCNMMYITSAAAEEHVFFAPSFLSEDLDSVLLVLSQPPVIQT